VARRKMAFGEARMMLEQPPQWLEGAPLFFLSARDRETISGDLLEEYREERVPRLGRTRANIWYMRQVISFASFGSSGGASLRAVLALVCVFVVASGLWLALMENILRHQGYPERIVIDFAIAAQGAATLIFLFIHGGAAFRLLVLAGAAGVLLLGIVAVTRTLAGPHFEGFVLIIGLGLIAQGLLTLLALWQSNSRTAV
jgi:hypothetical protein